MNIWQQTGKLWDAPGQDRHGLTTSGVSRSYCANVNIIRIVIAEFWENFCDNTIASENTNWE